MKLKIFFLLSFFGFSVFAQEKESKETRKAKELSDKYTHQGNVSLKNDKPVQAEVDYRKAIAENKDNSLAQYNLGTMYYKQKSYDEAFVRLKNASTSASISSEEKHKAFHNLGNVFMKSKAYDKAVQAYKEALRNVPTDEETRYNLAVAQEMLKKNPPPPQKDDKNQDNQQNQDKNENKNNENNKNEDKYDKKNDKNQQNQGDNKENQDKNQGKDQKDPKQDGQDKNPNGQGNGKNRPSSLSPEQIERILEAMNNEDQKTQEKINAQKTKGQRQKSEKDW